jgi:hypothetical protein
MDVISRRLDLLKLEGLGLSKVAIADQLSQKYGCTKRTIYHDFETRAKWQLALQGSTLTENLILKTLNRAEQIYGMASKIAIANDADKQIAALRLMEKTNSTANELAVLPDILARIKAIEQKLEEKK